MARGSGGRKSPICSEVREEAERRLAAGEPVGKVARSLNLAPGTVRSWRRRRELKEARSADDGVIANLIAEGRRMEERRTAEAKALGFASLEEYEASRAAEAEKDRLERLARLGLKSEPAPKPRR
jgi:uncharacterized protein YjcR